VPALSVLSVQLAEGVATHEAHDGRGLMPSSGNPAVRRRELGFTLRSLRAATRLTTEQVAERIGVSRSKISRLENGRRGASKDDITRLCVLYQVDEETRSRLAELATEGKKRASWPLSQQYFGDGVLVLVPAEVPKALLVESLPSALVAGLCEHNGAHSGPEQIRLRMALHAGEVCYDEHGVTAAAINLAFRLLEADPLRTALAESSGVLAVIASSWFFEEVVRHCSAVAGYRLVEVAVKETTTTGWICVP
jgi:transcriptional regulator with XRE-family HTH domain